MGFVILFSSRQTQEVKEKCDKELEKDDSEREIELLIHFICLVFEESSTTSGVCAAWNCLYKHERIFYVICNIYGLLLQFFPVAKWEGKKGIQKDK